MMISTNAATAEASDRAQAPPFQEYAREHAVYDTHGFVDKVKSMVGNHYMGYAVAIQDRNGNILASVNYGWARTPNAPDGKMAFSNNTQAPWGSVTKLLTATAVMRKVELRPNRRSLGDPIVDYLPPAWRKEVSKPYRTVTIGNLIQHRSGFEKKSPLTVRERLQQDPPEREIAGSRKYANINYTLFDYMPYFLTGQAEIDEPSGRLTDEEYDAAYRAQGARTHEKHLRKRIFDPIGVPISCNDPLHAGNNYARNYKGPDDEGEGYLVNQIDEPGAAVGGIIISPKGMLKFLHAISQTNQIVNRKTWRMMAQPGIERYGWPQTPEVRVDHSGADPTDTLAIAPLNQTATAYGHNGSRWGGKAKGQVFVFPNGMSAVAVANSKGTEDAPSLKNVLLQAYDAIVPQ